MGTPGSAPLCSPRPFFVPKALYKWPGLRVRRAHVLGVAAIAFLFLADWLMPAEIPVEVF